MAPKELVNESQRQRIVPGFAVYVRLIEKSCERWHLLGPPLITFQHPRDPAWNVETGFKSATPCLEKFSNIVSPKIAESVQAVEQHPAHEADKVARDRVLHCTVVGLSERTRAHFEHDAPYRVAEVLIDAVRKRRSVREGYVESN